MVYYLNPEYFTSHGESMRLNENKDEVWNIGHHKLNTVYGNILITKEDKGKFIWRFKTIEPADDVTLAIGIDSSQKHLKTILLIVMKIKMHFMAFRVMALRVVVTRMPIFE